MKTKRITFFLSIVLLLTGCSKNKVKTVDNYKLDDERIYSGEVINKTPFGYGKLINIKENTVYTGEFKDGLFHGEGLFEWKNKGDSLKGTFENNYPLNGTYTYKNTNYYQGTFNKDWEFHGEGIFNFSTFNNDGSIKTQGKVYEGEFKNNSTSDCYGKLTFDASLTTLGCQWFEGFMEDNFKISVGQTGVGRIKYDDGSVYEGDTYVESLTNFIRQGNGTQYFDECKTLTSASFGASHTVKLSKFVGEFDGVSFGWIYGNGVVYFTDENNNPRGYIKGNWVGTERIGDWVGRWKKDYLLEEYQNTEELEFRPVFERRLEEYVYINKDIDMINKTLLLGTSWFDFWKTSYEDLYPTLDTINFGIGGSGPIFWSENISALNGLKNAPDKIIYIPGGNDIASRGESIEDTVNKTKIVIEKLNEIFPNTKVYICSFGPSPLRWSLVNTMIYGNELLKELCDEESIFYFDFTTWLFNNYVSNGTYYLEGYGSLKTDIWTSDNLHFNDKGYKLVASKFIEYFSK